MVASEGKHPIFAPYAVAEKWQARYGWNLAVEEAAAP